MENNALDCDEFNYLEPQDDDSEDYLSVPLLIDVTLPVYLERDRDLVVRHGVLWRKLMEGIGIKKVKMPPAKIYSTDSLVGLDSAMMGDFSTLFSGLRELMLPEIIFGNGFGCATALAVAWLEAGGRGVVGSWGGAGGLPALEELRLMLHTSGILPLADREENFHKLREISELFSGEKTQSHKPVIGKAIFAVESGIHVDGLMKDPELYEPYPPKLVGGRRFLAVGLHSGRNSIRLKCERMNLFYDDELINELWNNVHARSLKLERALTDREFMEIYEKLFEKASDDKLRSMESS
jgi:homocitrate synthase NifV